LAANSLALFQKEKAPLDFSSLTNSAGAEDCYKDEVGG